MSHIETAILQMLRVFGPCSNADVARRLHMNADRSYRIVKELERRGLVIHPKKQRWDVSDRGRDVFDNMPLRPLALFAEET